jgi:hypothetical protein
MGYKVGTSVILSKFFVCFKRFLETSFIGLQDRLIISSLISYCYRWLTDKIACVHHLSCRPTHLVSKFYNTLAFQVTCQPLKIKINNGMILTYTPLQVRAVRGISQDMSWGCLLIPSHPSLELGGVGCWSWLLYVSHLY